MSASAAGSVAAKNGTKIGKKVTESVIRRMTRLAVEYDAVNLSQGFPNEAPPMNIRLALANAVLTGKPTASARNSTSIDNNNNNVVVPTIQNSSSSRDKTIDDLLHLLSSLKGNIDDHTSSSGDILNQYSPPMGREDLRTEISKYYKRLYDYDVDANNITVTLGATEALACALRSLGKPNDKAVVFEPFHELYPSQCTLFYLNVDYVTLRPSSSGGGEDSKKKQAAAATTTTTTWEFDRNELEEAMKDAKMLLLNTPHNPTGKIFTKDELQFIVDLCLKYNVYVVTDEIYEHMCYPDDKRHILLPEMFPQIKDLCLICNSIGKSASATGWRLGWCLHPPHISETYRGIHDQLTVMSPHPMQYATITYLNLPDSYFQKDLRYKYLERIETLSQTLTKLGFEVIMPEGAYYLFVKYRGVKTLSKYHDPMEAAMFLLKDVGVACVPGNNFYGKAIEDEGNQYLRFAACRSKEDIDEACRRLEKCL